MSTWVIEDRTTGTIIVESSTTSTVTINQEAPSTIIIGPVANTGSLLELTDTPSNYEEKAGVALGVRTDGLGLDFLGTITLLPTVTPSLPNTIFVDSTDSLLKFLDANSVVRTISLV